MVRLLKRLNELRVSNLSIKLHTVYRMEAAGPSLWYFDAFVTYLLFGAFRI